MRFLVLKVQSNWLHMASKDCLQQHCSKHKHDKCFLYPWHGPSNQTIALLAKDRIVESQMSVLDAGRDSLFKCKVAERQDLIHTGMHDCRSVKWCIRPERY